MSNVNSWRARAETSSNNGHQTRDHISCVPDKYCYLKWLTKLLKEAENNLYKHLRARGVPLHNEIFGQLSD